MTATTRKNLQYLKLIGQLTGVLSILLAAISVFYTNLAVRTSYSIDAHKTSQQLLMTWYDLKDRIPHPPGVQSIREPMQTELTAYKTLFIAESIFLMMQHCDQKANWEGTIEFLIKDATGLAINDKVIEETFDAEFAKRVKKVFDDGRNNKDEKMKKFTPITETARP